MLTVLTLLAVAAGLTVAGISWLIGYDVGYRQARRDVRGRP